MDGFIFSCFLVIDPFCINSCRFPLGNQTLLKKWLSAMKREKWTPTASSYLCGKHFLETDYTYPSLLPHSTSLGKKYLKKDAVPSVFKFPEHLQKRPVKERNPKKREFQAQHLCSDTVAIPAKNPRLDGHTYASSVSPRKLKTMYKAKNKKEKPNYSKFAQKKHQERKNH